jgi:hypothetical protein
MAFLTRHANSACKLALTTLLLAPCQAARADSMVDVQGLLQALRSAGTEIAAGNCNRKGLYGFYQPKGDQMVICLDNFSQTNPGYLWDVLAHESTHKMQACIGSYIMPPTHVGRMIRELRATNPETLKDLAAYPSAQFRQELEARWMEQQAPQDVITLLKAACKVSG